MQRKLSTDFGYSHYNFNQYGYLLKSSSVTTTKWGGSGRSATEGIKIEPDEKT
jgi:hypothetical protein